MNVTVANYQDAAAAVAALREFTSISNIAVGEATQSEDEAGVSRVAFPLTCSYGKNPCLRHENPYQDIISPPPSPGGAAADASASPAAEQTTGGDQT
mgnify:CR=1 FL=1